MQAPAIIEERNEKRPIDDVDPEDQEGGDDDDDDEQARILAMIEGDEEEGTDFNAADLKKLVLGFEKKLYKNQQMRVRYPDEPTKFLESEMDLSDDIQGLNVIATAPDLFATLVQLKVLPSILGLLSHDNTDIALSAVALLSEILDADTLSESPEDAEILLKAMHDAQLLPLLFQNLERLNESNREDAEGVHKTLTILENLCEIDDNTPSLMLKGTKMLPWIRRRLLTKGLDANKLYCSELLSIILQTSKESRRKLATENGIDDLLRILAGYRNKDPQTPEEVEYLNNLFDSVTTTLLESEGKKHFLQGEGVELMIIMLREKKMAVFGAMKALSFATTGDEVAMCKRFVEKRGLKSLFPRFMKVPKNAKGVADKGEYEEHVCSVLNSLLRNIRDSTLRNRLLNKFVEDNFAKVERLIELHLQYSEKVAKEDHEIARETVAYLAEEKSKGDEHPEIPPEMTDMFYLRRLENGLCCLQLVDSIIAEIMVAGIPQIRGKIKKLLAQQERSLYGVIDVLDEFASMMGEETTLNSSSTAKVSREKAHIQDLVSKLQDGGMSSKD
ncbi:hypothetical protein SARC_01651 [Sphaeroforma arctica JP610]|uniref:Beta-catenin-like protein 1 N-terminal domain-containing protein n=1 Tax=Sphaeroforma arctica JP610 TaxID=667725 RepID=A0A0L0GD57_9EUKA|nr:hypothetical protein SARC_01651 [Sphaeroforma arctica JP610]KNC86173.1 hypothetical protein SARC_01651 [Sphaeroforma arctica JP610]|eukprot:XP_014160075.1 hypothetical protein SARC_01651 [Sphaeroforma arctica JP610]